MANNVAAVSDVLLSTTRSAYERVRADIVAVPRERVQTINLEIKAIVAIALGTASYLPRLRARIEALGAEVDVGLLFKLEDYAHALLFVQGDSLFAVAPADALPALHDEGLKLKDVLLPGALALSASGLLPNDRVLSLRNPNGYKELGEYLDALATLFTDYWATISNKTAITIGQINRASDLGVTLIRSAGIKARAQIDEDEATLTRGRAFTLLVETYQEVRDVVLFLRRKERDGEQIAPSFYSGRNTGGPRPKEPAPVPAPTPPVVGGDLDAPAPRPLSAVPTGHPDAPPF